MQTAVYWAPSGRDTHGQRTYATPVEIACRWDDRAVEFLNPQGERLISSAVVGISEVLKLGGILRLGLLTDLTDEDNPRANSDVWEIRQLSAIPTFDGDETFREAFL